MDHPFQMLSEIRCSAISEDYKLKSEKTDKLEFVREMKKLWNMNIKVEPIITSILGIGSLEKLKETEI